jgi:hypothetical protein
VENLHSRRCHSSNPDDGSDQYFLIQAGSRLVLEAREAASYSSSPNCEPQKPQRGKQMEMQGFATRPHKDPLVPIQAILASHATSRHSWSRGHVLGWCWSHPLRVQLWPPEPQLHEIRVSLSGTARDWDLLKAFGVSVVGRIDTGFLTKASPEPEVRPGLRADERGQKLVANWHGRRLVDLLHLRTTCKGSSLVSWCPLV